MCVLCADKTAEFLRHEEAAPTREAQAFTAPNYYVAALLGSDSWTGTTGTAANVTTSFGYSTEGNALLGSGGQQGARSAMQAWANVANIRFTGVSSDADITFSQANLGGFGAAGITYSTVRGSTTQHAEVVIDNDYTGFPPNSFAYLVMLHEVGHAIGLKHPGQYGSDTGPFLPEAEDSYNATVMSYNDGVYGLYGTAPVTPMIYDIAAIQTLYGANTGYNAGNSEYRFDATKQAMTIWDGGGIDTIVAPNAGGGIGNATIDLREGLGNMSAIGGSVVWIAFGAHIENAVAASGNDTVFGNGFSNQLFGGTGVDSIHGGDGGDAIYGGRAASDTEDVSDVLYGDRGADTILGNAGNDTLFGGRGVSDTEDANDTIYGGKGFDLLYGNAGNDALYGGGAASDPEDQADLVYGGKGADTILGNGSNDTLYGGGAESDPEDQADQLLGGAGSDLIFGNGGNDTITGADGNDTLHAGLANDVYVFENGGGVDQILLFEGAGISGGDRLQLQSGLNGSGITSFSGLQSHLSLRGADLYVDLGGGNGVLINGINALGADDVSFF